jgi:hypothetical protein
MEKRGPTGKWVRVIDERKDFRSSTLAKKPLVALAGKPVRSSFGDHLRLFSVGNEWGDV